MTARWSAGEHDAGAWPALDPGREPGAVGPGADGVHAGVPHHPRAARGVVGVHGADRQLPRASSTTIADALQLAQRWSKYMAVTFAVGAVTGTVLTFEFGLLWPRFMGQWGEAFGVPFAFEGLFFFTEAIFIAIYIYGWRRLKPWTHFWTGVPLVITGILGSVVGRRRQRLDERAVGVHAQLRRQGRRRRPAGGDLQRRDAADGRPHGDRGLRRRRVPHRVGLRVRACCAAGATATTASASSSRSPSARSPSRSRWASATRSPAGCSTTSRRSSPPSSSCPRPPATSPRPCSAISTPTARSRGGIPIPGLASWLSDPATAPARWSRASTPCPPTNNPTLSEVNTVHLAWDVMVGLGTLLFLLSLWYGLCWLFRRDMPKSRWFLRVASIAGVAAVVTHGGRLGGQRGRPPAVDRLQPHEGRGRRHRPTPGSGSRSCS